MYELLLTLHILISITLVIIILLQSGKTGGLGGMFGGGGSEALLSAPSGSSFVRKLTVGFSIAFVVTTLLLAVLGSRRVTRSVFERIPVQQQRAE